MADRHARALAECAAISAARRFAAQTAHATAATEEAVVHAAHDRAEQTLAAVVSACQREMAVTFDPMLGGLQAQQIVSGAARVTAAEAQVTVVREQRESCATRWRSAEARCRQIDDVRRDHRRLRARARDEQQLRAVADRTTFHWRGR